MRRPELTGALMRKPIVTGAVSGLALGAVLIGALGGFSSGSAATSVAVGVAHPAAPVATTTTAAPTVSYTSPSSVAPTTTAATTPTTVARPVPAARPAPARAAKPAPAPVPAQPSSVLGPWQPIPGNASPAPATAGRPGRPAPVATPAPAPTTPTTVAPLGMGDPNAYKFEELEPDGSPVRMDKAEVVHYRISSYDLVAGSDALMKQAFQTLSQAVGLTFVFDGYTSQPADSNWLNDQPVDASGQIPVVIGWDTANSDPIDNCGGPVMACTRRRLDNLPSMGPGWQVTVSAVISLNLATQEPENFGVNSEGTIMLHELGHLAGLDLVSDPAQVMHSGLDGQPGRYAAGDLTGLGIIERAPEIQAPNWS